MNNEQWKNLLMTDSEADSPTFPGLVENCMKEMKLTFPEALHVVRSVVNKIELKPSFLDKATGIFAAVGDKVKEVATSAGNTITEKATSSAIRRKAHEQLEKELSKTPSGG